MESQIRAHPQIVPGEREVSLVMSSEPWEVGSPDP